MFELCPMSSDFHVQPRELNLRTLHCLFDQSHVALQCSITCIPTCFITMVSFLAKHNVLKLKKKNYWAPQGSFIFLLFDNNEVLTYFLLHCRKGSQKNYFNSFNCLWDTSETRDQRRKNARWALSANLSRPNSPIAFELKYKSSHTISPLFVHTYTGA